MSHKQGAYKPKYQQGGAPPAQAQQSAQQRPYSAAGAAGSAGPSRPESAIQRPPQYQERSGRGGYTGSGGHSGGRVTHERKHLANVAVPTNSALVPSAGASPGHVRLVSNFMSVKTEKNLVLYQYSVQVDAAGQDLNPRRKRFFIVQLMLKLLGKDSKIKWVYNGEGMLFSQAKLPENKFSHNLHGTVSSIEYTKEIVVSDKSAWEQATHALNLVLKTPLQEAKLVKIGRNYFDVDHADAINDRLKVAMGIDAAIQWIGDRPLLCADVIFKAINKQTPLDMIYALRQKFKTPSDWKAAILGQFKGKIVVKNYCRQNGRRQNGIVDDVDLDKSPEKYSFEHEGKKTTVLQYFKDKYKITIKDPKQPLFVHRRGTGKDQSTEYLVPELLLLTGIDTEQRQAMTDYTGMTATNRAKQIMHSLKETKVAGTLKPWGVDVDPTFIEVNSTVQSAVRLGFAKEIMTTKDASWVYFDRKFQPVRPKHLEKGRWAFVYPEHVKDKVDTAWEVAKKAAPGLGIKLDEPIWEEVDLREDDSLADMLEEYKAAFKFLKENNKNLEIVLFMATDKDEAFYGALERYLYFNCGVAAQCIQDKTLNNPKKHMGVMSNILRQMTYKIGAVPYTLPDLAGCVPKDCMLIGIDVHHSGEIGERRKQGSVVGFSATVDAAASQFWSGVVTQQPGQEIITSLSGLFTQAVEAYKKNSKKAPANIIVLRDGVGEGQLKQVKEKEIAQLNQVLTGMKVNAKISVVVVMKRIRDRLFQQQAGSTAQNPNFNNPAPGTVVSEGIVDPDEFIMIAHKPMSISKEESVCVSPVRFKMIHNDINLGKQQLQQIVWQLCHGYFALDHTIKVPNLCHHAHRISFLHGMMEKGLRTFQGEAGQMPARFSMLNYFV